jgi:hypothetical protein
MQDFNEFLTECDRAPRLNHLAEFFAETAAGKGGVPVRRPVADARLLPHDTQVHRIVDLHARRQGFFDHHYHGSIPYRLEEECRMSLALLRYAQTSTSAISLYTLGTAEGTMARTLSEMGHGKIKSLACSPNEENYKCFMAFGEPAHANFFLGPFHRLTKDHLKSQSRIEQFSSGFDFILEDTTFQMYSPNRRRQIEFVTQHLKDDGILLFVEKFRGANPQEYEQREYQKDFGFKARYFGAREIERKSTLVLSAMHNNEVTLHEMAAAVYAHFRHCVITWNSGNFYGLAASNSGENLRRYLSFMAEPAIPSEYVYQPEPYLELSAWVSRQPG